MLLLSVRNCVGSWVKLVGQTRESKSQLASAQDQYCPWVFLVGIFHFSTNRTISERPDVIITPNLRAQKQAQKVKKQCFLAINLKLYIIFKSLVIALGFILLNKRGHFPMYFLA